MTGQPVSLMLIDEDEQFLRSFGCALEARGLHLWTARTFRAADRILARASPSYVISELRIGGRRLTDYMNEIASKVPAQRFAVLTAYPSVATAVQMTRAGVASYLTKPVLPQVLFGELGLGDNSAGMDGAQTLEWPTLGRITWEYLSQMCVSAGSLSEAARRLGIDRRSLRRMLSKTPPAR